MNKVKSRIICFFLNFARPAHEMIMLITLLLSIMLFMHDLLYSPEDVAELDEMGDMDDAPAPEAIDMPPEQIPRPPPFNPDWQPGEFIFCV